MFVSDLVEFHISASPVLQLDKHDYLVRELHLADRGDGDETLVHLALLDISQVGELWNELELVFADLFRDEDFEGLVAVAHLPEGGAFLLHEFNRLPVLEEIVDVDALEDVHLIWAGALLGRVPDDVDDNVVVHFLEFHITKGNQWGGGILADCAVVRLT